MLPMVYIFFLCIEFAAITAATSQSHASNPETLHSYMKHMYTTAAQGNGNGSFTIALRNQKILATSIRGYEPEKYGTTWKGSTIEMQFRLGNAFKDDTVVEAELIVTSKQGRMGRSFAVSVYDVPPVFAPNVRRRLDSRAFPHGANVEFGLNVTRVVEAWSLTSVKTYKLQLMLEDLFKRNDTTNSVFNVRRYLKHGHQHGPFLVLYTQSNHQHTKDDIWKMVTLINWRALSSKVGNRSTVGKNHTDIIQKELPGKSDNRTPRNPSLTCYQVSFAIKMRDFYSNIIMPQIAYINYCDGYCFFPIQNHLTPTTHAILWALWWKRQNTHTPKRPLCVPSKLGTQAVILSDPETGQPVQKEWQEFSAKECGCR